MLTDILPSTIYLINVLEYYIIMINYREKFFTNLLYISLINYEMQMIIISVTFINLL